MWFLAYSLGVAAGSPAVVSNWLLNCGRAPCTPRLYAKLKKNFKLAAMHGVQLLMGPSVRDVVP